MRIHDRMVESEKVEIQLLDVSCCEKMAVCNSHQINGEDVGSLDLYFLGLFFDKKLSIEKNQLSKQVFMTLTLTFPMKG